MVIGRGASGSKLPPLTPRCANSQITASNGSSLIATVTIESPPAARTPIALTAVSSTTQPIASGTTIVGPPNSGPMKDKAEAAPIATEACATQLETQNAQAARNATVGPNSRSILA